MSIIAKYLNLRLPEEMVKEIIGFLIPEISKIYFETRYPNSNYSSFSRKYSRKYEIAFLNENKIMNNKIINAEKLYLSRISKKNGKHRYYITKELIDSIEVEYNDRDYEIYHYDYISSYVGKNISFAILKLMYE